jgi:radical SAM superfamily enzyme YgiQ (UPF0313 family)
LDLYKKEIRLPFRCSLRADLTDEETVCALKESGCGWVKLGLETGNEHYRNKILKKKISDEDFIKTSDLLHKYRIPFSTSNLLGLPGETLEMALETLKLNIKLRPQHTMAFAFMPYPGTELGQYSLDEGYVESPKIRGEDADSFKRIPLKSKDRDQMENLQKFFAWVTLFPALFPIVKLLIKLPPNRFFIYLEKISRFLFFWCRRANFPGLVPSIREFLFGFGFRPEKSYNRSAKNTLD